MSITIYGASDDLIEVDGDISEEFDIGGDSEIGKALAFSDGTVVRVVYDDDGNWRVNVLHKGTSDVSHTPAGQNDLSDDEEDYSDRLTLSGDIAWVVCGDAWASSR